MYAHRFSGVAVNSIGGTRVNSVITIIFPYSIRIPQRKRNSLLLSLSLTLWPFICVQCDAGSACIMHIIMTFTREYNVLPLCDMRFAHSIQSAIARTQCTRDKHASRGICVLACVCICALISMSFRLLVGGWGGVVVHLGPLVQMHW